MLRRLLVTAALMVAALVGPKPAAAYTPEGGVWYNPDEYGTGLVIEIQDNFMFVAAFVGDLQGNPTWYTAAGFLSGNARFEGFLDRSVNVQCIGCAWRVPNYQFGAGGPIRIDFDPNDPTRASLTWGGRTKAIQRYHFYLKRPEDGSRSITLTKMLGEWQFVLDFSRIAGSFPYYGELLLFDRIDTSAAPGYFDGCRGQNSIDGFCNSTALRDHAASGYYDANTRKQVIVVDDSALNYAVYVISVGTNDALGEVSVYRKGTNPVNYYPTRGHRTASRTFVLEGTGPSKTAAAGAATPGIADAIPALLDAKANGGVEPSIERSRLLAIVRELEVQLEARRAAR